MPVVRKEETVAAAAKKPKAKYTSAEFKKDLARQIMDENEVEYAPNGSTETYMNYLKEYNLTDTFTVRYKKAEHEWKAEEAAAKAAKAAESGEAPKVVVKPLKVQAWKNIIIKVFGLTTAAEKRGNGNAFADKLVKTTTRSKII